MLARVLCITLGKVALLKHALSITTISYDDPIPNPEGEGDDKTILDTLPSSDVSPAFRVEVDSFLRNVLRELDCIKFKLTTYSNQKHVAVYLYLYGMDDGTYEWKEIKPVGLRFSISHQAVSQIESRLNNWLGVTKQHVLDLTNKAQVLSELLHGCE